MIYEAKSLDDLTACKSLAGIFVCPHLWLFPLTYEQWLSWIHQQAGESFIGLCRPGTVTKAFAQHSLTIKILYLGNKYILRSTRLKVVDGCSWN